MTCCTISSANNIWPETPINTFEQHLPVSCVGGPQEESHLGGVWPDDPATVTYGQKELELKKQRAELDLEKATLEADLEALGLEKAAAAANAETEILEAAARFEYEDIGSVIRSDVSSQVIKQRTEAYLDHQAQTSFSPNTPAPNTLPSPYIKKTQPLTTREAPELSPIHRHDGSPTTPTHTKASAIAPAANMIDFAKYLARRELVTTGFTKFDDQPESFRAWQSSFLNATQDLDLTASEELDLLVKWLGKESSEHIKRMRAVHVTNPEAALQMSWTRLRECYATPEVIESALFKRLDNFPRLTSRENIKLRELSDLLMELLSAKDDGYLPGLSYLDTPRGINPIVEKLPINLQEKWLSTGSRYKEHCAVSYPPFSFFADFVNGEAKARNDPSFVVMNNSCTPFRNDRPIAKHDGVRTTIAVHKIDLSAAAGPSSMYRTEMENKHSGDPAKYCPLHNKAHPLEKCRAFKMKPLTERKGLLRDHRRCFRCCSATHMAKDCSVKLKCFECESDRHCTAMHPDIHLSPAVSSVTEPDTAAKQHTFRGYVKVY
ncbi:hypothetical protein N1851_013070 [Merluccius polli]|uniref:Uncharacterized protein n=1 Tax=Merluccius polli TaxID=89951 RepID=A0AA47P1Y1_MERPO|nr:hypothetical protein N1851_013070 [Merluccius polli]